MTQPIALMFYERLLPGSRLVNRLQDLNYCVQVVANADQLVECAKQAKPMLVVADLKSKQNNVCPALVRLKQNPATRHLPVVAFCGENDAEWQEATRMGDVILLVSEAAILNHLPQFLEQALQVE